LARKTKIPFEIQHRNDGGGHHFGIRHPALPIFMVMQGFQHVITQAKNDYNLGVHEFLLYVGGWDTPTVPETHGFFYTRYPR
jgi:hypothetical protein